MLLIPAPLPKQENYKHKQFSTYSLHLKSQVMAECTHVLVFKISKLQD